MNNIKTKVFAVIDTNVIISMINSRISTSATREIGRLIDSGNVIPIFDERILSEYYHVLNYSKFNLLPEVVSEYIGLFLSKGIFVKDTQRINDIFKDPTDIPFYEVSLSTSELNTELVTGNVKHYPIGSCVPPRTFVNNILYIEKNFSHMFGKDYDQAVQDTILKLVETDKYYLGNLLPDEFLKKIEEKRLEPQEHINLDDYLKD